MDATVAVSQSGVNKLIQQLLSSAQVSKSGSGSWGPFSAGYTVSAKVTGGTIELVDAPIQLIRLHDFNVSASAAVHVGFDLGNILPHLCFPPVRICVDIPWVGHFCTPQWCVPWPSIGVSLTVPISFNISADFGLEVRDGGSAWDVVLLVYPFSLVIDPSPTINAILEAVRQEVDGVLNGIPLIGGFLAHLLDLVIGALQGVIGAIAGAIDALIHEVVLLIDVFSPTIPVKLISFNKVEVMLPASGPGDPDVDIVLASVTARIAQQELIAEATIA
jgi:hypothetical protein